MFASDWHQPEVSAAFNSGSSDLSSLLLNLFMAAMDDFPEDDFLDDLELPTSPTASALDALETPTPSQLSFAWSSDEIPILLYDDGYVDEASISRLSTATAGGNRESFMTLRGARLSYGDRMSMYRGSHASMVDLAGLSALESSNTICSVGTFGPKRKKPSKLDETRMSGHRTTLPGSPSPADVSPLPTPVPSTESEKRSSTVSRRRSSTQTLSGVFANPTVLVTTKRDSISVPNPRDLAQYSSLESSERSYEVDLSVEIDDNSFTCRTPEKPQVPRTTSWISTRDWDCQQYKEYISREDQSRTSPSVRVLEDHSAQGTPPLPVTPPRRRTLNPHNTLTKPRPLPISHEIVDPEVSFPSPKRLIRQASDVDWLQDITVQFLVDQEGFRAAQPNFRFAGIARLRSSQHSKSPDTVMAQFRPTIRQAFHFHYAPFESPPVLRRVTVDDDETHDYVSKQAYLTTKTNGVYVLYGHEMSTTTHDSEASKLYWQFEYLVDDRLLDGSGRIMEGEKILTPLTFSCTPSLLSPGQGRRNNIMHVFKKGVAPKLVSEKLQAPGTARPQNGVGDAGTLASSQTDAHISHFFSSKAHTWNIHRRGQSHGVRNAEPPMPQAVQRSPASELRRSEHRLPRRRRASSADENHKPAVQPHGTSDDHHHVYSAGGAQIAIPLAQHIVPPAKLTQLLGSPVEGSTRDNPFLSNKRDTGGFIPLTPRPRHPHTKLVEPVRTN